MAKEFAVKDNLTMKIQDGSFVKMMLADVQPDKQFERGVSFAEQQQKRNSDGVLMWACSVLAFPEKGKPQLLPLKVPSNDPLTDFVGESIYAKGLRVNVGTANGAGYFSMGCDGLMTAAAYEQARRAHRATKAATVARQA